MAYALINNGIVKQVDRSGQQPLGFVFVPDSVVVGQVFQNGEFVDPEAEPSETPQPTPQYVTEFIMVNKNPNVPGKVRVYLDEENKLVQEVLSD